MSKSFKTNKYLVVILTILFCSLNAIAHDDRSINNVAAIPLGDEIHNFTLSNTSSSFYSILGNLSTIKGTVNYNGLTLTKCLKIETDTRISYTTTASSTLTLVFFETAPTIKVDGISYTGSGRIITVTLLAGNHTITKQGIVNLFYVSTKYNEAVGIQTLTSPANNNQTVTCGTPVSSIVYTWGGDATDVNIIGLPVSGISFIKNTTTKTITISGTPTANISYSISTSGIGGTPVTSSGAVTVIIPPVSTGDEIHNFTLSDNSSSFYSILGNLSTIKGIVNYNGLTLTKCLKIESETRIYYTTTASSTLTLVFAEAVPTIKVDGINYTGTGGIITVTLAAGSHTITKQNTASLFYISTTYAPPSNNNQTVTCGTAISPIVYTWGSSTTDVTVTGLPSSGISFIKDATAKTITISGTPTAAETFPYTLTFTGGCRTVTAIGSIVVTPSNTIVLSPNGGTDTQVKCVSTAITPITYSTTGATGASFSYTTLGGTGTTIPGLPAGVTGSFASNVVTISGTPVAVGAFSYTITLTGGCGVVTKTGSITVVNNTISLSSGSGAENQTVYLWNPITPISYSTIGATNVTVSGLPDGITGNFASNVFVISGTSTKSGNFNYKVTMTGPCGTITTVSKKIIVLPNNYYTLSSGPGSNVRTQCANTKMKEIIYTTQGVTAVSFSPMPMPAGITATFVTTTITIKGTPTVTGTFPYTITLTGVNGDKREITGGAIVVTANNTVTLSPDGGTDAQTICLSTPITPITYSTTGATGADFSGLPSGVTGNFGSNTVTISGTPTVTGTFPYTIALTGGCGNITTTGSITVTANNTIVLSSGNNSQTKCIATAINPIIYSTTGATGADFSGLPAGVTGSFASDTVTISGNKVGEAGTFLYTITLTGGCGTVKATGTINILPKNILTLTSAEGTNGQTQCLGTAITPISYFNSKTTKTTFSGLPAGVTGSFESNGNILISGTPTVTGTFLYTVNLIESCGSVNAKGSITVTPNTTITLSSAEGTNAQIKCIATAITPITYSTTGATGATFSYTNSAGTGAIIPGLPAGVTGSFASNTVTISGAPTNVGTFNYTITLTGCGNVTASGSISVATNSIPLNFGSGAEIQTVYLWNPIVPISYSTIGATNVTVSGLPEGITGNWTANTFVISGTSAKSGNFNYKVTMTGPCGTVTKSGKITVIPNNYYTLSSGPGSNVRTQCANTKIKDIIYTTQGVTAVAVSFSPMPMPAGITATFVTTTITIKGTPTVTGTFPYTITLTGVNGDKREITGGAIIVTPNNTITLSPVSGSNAQNLCLSTAITPITYATTGATGADFSGLPAGVTGSFGSDTVTISGTPTVTGTFPYTINLTGGCGTVNATGSISVTPNTTIVLSPTGTNAQTLCLSTAITPITYSTAGAIGADFSGLPAGVTGSFASNVVTISGTPTVTGTFSYTVNLIGLCGNVNATGTISVTSNNTITLSPVSGSNAQNLCLSTAITPITYMTTGATGAGFSGLPAGVTGSFASNVVTISGTPTVTGTFSYTVNLIGSCGNVNATGTISVTQNNTITLSPIGTNAQTVCLSTAITPITYSTTGATGADFSGLPAGITGSFASNIVTISGTPTVTGTFPYTVTLIGSCGNVNATGSIIVKANNTIGLSPITGTSAQTVCLSAAITPTTYSVNGATGATFSGLPAGVTGSFESNTVTISGTPTSVGAFSYTINLSGGCETISKTGSITVIPNATAVLTSGVGTVTQAKCPNTAIDTIVYTTSGVTDATFLGLPAGVTGSFASDTVTISGTPTSIGTFNYSITLTVGCGNIKKTGSIIVTPNASIVLSSAEGTNNQTKNKNTAITNITYTTTGAIGASFSGLPAGVNGIFALNVVTISGVPIVTGVFNYNVALMAACGSTTIYGKITAVEPTIECSPIIGEIKIK